MILKNIRLIKNYENNLIKHIINIKQLSLKIYFISSIVLQNIINLSNLIDVLNTKYNVV